MTMQVKLNELSSFLESVKNKKVGTILEEAQASINELIELANKQPVLSRNAKNFVRDENGVTMIVFCYYHKRWEIVSQASYGNKANSPSLLTSMCREGIKAWNKQQKAKKTAQVTLLDQVAKGEVKPSWIGVGQDQIAFDAKEITPREDGHGFESSEAALAAM